MPINTLVTGHCKYPVLPNRRVWHILHTKFTDNLPSANIFSLSLCMIKGLDPHPIETASS